MENDLQRGVKPRSDWSWRTLWTTSYDQNCQLGRATWQWKRLESGEKSDRNGEPFYTTTLQMHYKALTLTSNSMTEQEHWFFDSDSSSNQSVQSGHCVWILYVMVASESRLHIQLLSSDSSVYFNKLHSNTSSGSAPESKSQTKNKPHEIPQTPNGYGKQNQHRNLMKFIEKHPWVHVLKKEKQRKQSGSYMLKSSKSDSTYCTIINLNSAKI